MILLVSTCAHKLSEHEFVKPVRELIKDNCFVKHYSKVSKSDLDKAGKVIICGTALKDFDYLQDDFSWLNGFKKPVIGICAGFQVIARALSEELIDKTLIGRFKVNDFNAYFIISKLIKATNVKELASIDGFTCMFEQENFVGCAFHPEVLNPEIILDFCNNS